MRGKPIYSIKDVTLIPLSSQSDAEEAIFGAGRALGQDKKTAAEDTEESDIEDDAETGSVNDEAPGEAAEAFDAPSNTPLKKSTTFVKDVVQDKGLYGRFANKWFSKSGWAASGRKRQGMSEEQKLNAEQAREGDKALPEDEKVSETVNVPQTVTGPVAQENTKDVESPLTSKSNIESLTPRILRSARLYFSSSSFFFSYDHDLSTSMQSSSSSTLPLCKRFDPLFFWNRNLISPFIDAGHNHFALPLLQGFVGQRAFSITQTSGESDQVVDPADSTLR